MKYGNDNGNTFSMSIVESKFDLFHRVINNGQFSEVSRSSSLTSFQSWYLKLGHLKSLSTGFVVVVVVVCLLFCFVVLYPAGF